MDLEPSFAAHAAGRQRPPQPPGRAGMVHGGVLVGLALLVGLAVNLLVWLGCGLGAGGPRDTSLSVYWGGGWVILSLVCYAFLSLLVWLFGAARPFAVALGIGFGIEFVAIQLSLLHPDWYDRAEQAELVAAIALPIGATLWQHYRQRRADHENSR